MERKVKLTKDFIGIYDGYIMDQECDNVIDLYKKENELKNTFTRAQIENAAGTSKSDTHLFLNSSNVYTWQSNLKVFMANFDIAMRDYIQKIDFKTLNGCDVQYTTMKIQKTLPGQGYHDWHIEHSLLDPTRCLVWAVYLNTVEDGGETEFLHFSERVKPVKGRIVIWPAGFPYVHRGNPPLSGEKYIITSWMMLPYASNRTS